MHNSLYWDHGDGNDLRPLGTQFPHLQNRNRSSACFRALSGIPRCDAHSALAQRLAELLRNLWAQLQNENAGPLAQKIIKNCKTARAQHSAKHRPFHVSLTD